MNEITILSPKTLAEAKDLATVLAGARTIPEALQKSPADVLAIVMAGAELGLAPMQSIRALVLIKGKPTLSADAMGALVKSRPDICEWLVLRHSDAERATYETKRKGEPTPTTMSFTSADAKLAGLNGDNWRKFPAAMLRARAQSALCRAVYQDLLLGVYDPDEIAPLPDTPRSVTSRLPPLDPKTEDLLSSARGGATESDPSPYPHRYPRPTATESEAETIAALKASINMAQTQSKPRMFQVPTEPKPEPAQDYGLDGTPLSERAKIDVAVEEAQDEASLNALVERISKLPAVDKAAIRVRWCTRRDELKPRGEPKDVLSEVVAVLPVSEPSAS
jgi:hypothetical protein